MGPDDFERHRIFLTDRGLFLLTIGHLLIMHRMCHTRFDSSRSPTGWRLHADRPWLVTVHGVRERLLLASATFFLSTLGSIFWEPTGHLAIVVKEALFGAYGDSGNSGRVCHPALVSFNVAASALGDSLDGTAFVALTPPWSAPVQDGRLGNSLRQFSTSRTTR